MNLLVLSTELWDAKRQARKELLYKAMLQSGNVESLLYVEPMALWWRHNTVSSRDFSPEERVRVCRWSCPLPGERSDFVQRFNRFWQARRVEACLNNDATYIGIFYHPANWLVARRLQNKVKWYYDWTEDWGVYQDSPSISKLQEIAITNAYGVITVCETLYERACTIRGSRQNVLMLPNATALNASARQYDVPVELAPVARPRIGLMGHVGPWMDVDLIMQLAADRPDWQWFILGDARGEVRQKLLEYANIHLLGIHPYEQLPAFMAYADVLVAPYNSRAQGDSSKLYDYLTSGKPVVASRLDTTRRLSAGVTAANGHGEWLAAIEIALQQKQDETLARIRRDIASQNSWAERSQQLVRWLEER